MGEPSVRAARVLGHPEWLHVSVYNPLPHYTVVTVIGAGLLGASLGLALKARGMVGTVRGVGHRRESLEAAREVGAIDEGHLDAREAAVDADLVVICTPAELVAPKLDEIRDVCRSDALVTDVASTKGLICRHAENTWPQPLRFVGSHPMAGSEKFGPEHASATLYENSTVIMTPCHGQAEDAYEGVKRLWMGVGARIAEMDAQIHDVLVARTSHIPHILAACIAELAADAGEVRAVVGNGFRDVTRVAAGRPEIWRDICLTNRDAICEGLLRLIERVDEVRRMIAIGGAHELLDFFKEGQESRRRILGE